MTDYPNWFRTTAQGNFERHLLPVAGTRHYRALQIGAYVGHASEWLCRHVLLGHEAYLHDVDTWEGSDEPAHKAFDWQDAYETYCERIKPWIGYRVLNFKMTSDEFFEPGKAQAQYRSFGPPLYRFPDMYDFVYIDGDHARAQVLRDAENAWPHLKVGGIIAFDDYLWRSGRGYDYDPYGAINEFMEQHVAETQVLALNSQVWLRRTA